MNLNNYFDPVSLNKPEEKKMIDPYLFCKNVIIHTPDLPIKNPKEFDIALIGVREGRESYHSNCSEAPDNVRDRLYQLNRLPGTLKIIDLGNIKETDSVNDTYFGLRDVLEYLLSINVIPVIIGGGKNLTYSAYLAAELNNDRINVVIIDSTIEFGKVNEVNFPYFLNKILTGKKNKLFNFSNLGYQSCFVDKDTINDLNSMFFSTHRIGMVRSDFKDIEPTLRDADVVSFCMNAIKQSDAPAHYNPSPNGFYSEEACQIARYTGLSNKLSVFGIFELYPEFDQNQQSAHLAAQMIWYFIEGVSHRKNEDLSKISKEFKKFIVNLDEEKQDLIFYKNTKSNRWWLAVPFIKSKKQKNLIIACSEEDYNKACSHEIPDRWWRTFQKIN